MNKPIASYTYQVNNIKGRPFIIIEDTRQSAISVTKDIVNVVEKICNDEIISPCEHFIIYRDRKGIWDGYNFATGYFVELKEQSSYAAAIKMLEQ